MNRPDQPSSFIRYWPAILALIVVAGAVTFLALFKPPFSQTADNRQILYGYAAQLRSGNGLVFNPGERVLLIAAPVYMLLLAIFTTLSFTPNVVPSAEWLFMAALALGALSLYRIARRTGLSLTVASVVALLYAIAWPLWLGVGTALPVMTGVSLFALDMALESRW